MASVDRRKLQAALQTLKANAIVQVAFVLDGQGALVAWAGKSSGFSPVGQFPSRGPAENDVNLYLTMVGKFYLGILFRDGEEVDAVRGLVDVEGDALRASLGVPPEQGA